jgi:uncharacterized SAM-binding protein YcdF (DUF218 family)
MIAGVVRMLILPPASLFLLLALGLLLARRCPRVSRVLRVGAVALLFFLSTGWGARMLVYPLEHMTRALPESQHPSAQAIVVLAAGRYVNAPEYGGAEIPDYIALARLRYAAHLYRATSLPLLVSGGNGTPDGSLKPKAKAMAAALEYDFGIPVKWIEPASATTAENALFSARLLKQENVSRILLVTDAMHMPRSVMAFRENGLQVIPAPTIFFSAGELTWLDLLPDAEHLRRSYYALYEWIGLGWYFMRYAMHDGGIDQFWLQQALMSRK